jgi:UDP-N-acetylglucosamine--N-acetylmuramyl-(pentapeptide) pyrophosphoryl-undecaprenol N-acetylglucosamine transferase
VPLPHALDADQLQNAIHLADAGGALCIEQKDFTPERLTAELVKLFDAPQVLETMAEAAQSQGRPDAVARLADLVADLIAKRVK